MHGSIGPAAVAIFAPILRGQRRHVQRRSRQLDEVGDGAPGLRVGQVLQDVVANHQIEGFSRREIADRPPHPTEAFAEVRARFETAIARPRIKVRERLAQQP